MERILINIGQIIQNTVESEDGRRIVGELALNLMSYAAAAAIGAAAAEEAPATVAAAPAPVAPAPATVAAPAPATVAAPPVPVSNTLNFALPIVTEAATAEAEAPVPRGYTLVSKITNEIGADMRAFDSHARAPQDRAAHISRILAKVAANPGLLIQPKFFTAVNSTIDRLIGDLAAYKDQPWAKSYTEEYAARKRMFNWYTLNGVRYTWVGADGVRTTVVGTRDGSFLEIRRGALTGRALQNSQPRTCASGILLLNHWTSAGIPFSTIATAPY
jgi:hypothetical protein